MTDKRLQRHVTVITVGILTSVMVLSGSGVSLPEALPEAGADVPFVRGSDAASVPQDSDLAQAIASMRTALLPQPFWPGAATAEAALTAGQVTTVPGTPVTLISSAGAVSRVSVVVHGHDETITAGRDATVLVDVTRTDGGGNGTLSITVDYSSFAHAYGGGWRDRLQLWTVPDCAECAPVPLDTTNDLAAGTLTAEAPVYGQKPTTLAVSAAAAGGDGDYTATSLSPSATWSQGGSSGSFDWSYPMAAPNPVGAGPVPSVGLSYSSASVDGRSEATNNQPGAIGEGFAYSAGSIERRYVPCSEDMDSANNTTKTGDRCWKTDNAILSMDGRAGELVKDDNGRGWHLKNDDGTKIQRFTSTDSNPDNDTVNGDNNDEYWKLTTADGTQYFFGLNRLPGYASASQKESTNSVWTMPVAGNNTDEPCHAPAFEGSFCAQAWKWNLDYVVDVHGNTMSYWYDTETNLYGKTSDASKPVPYTRSGELKRIDYGTDQRDGSEYGGTVPGRVEFTYSDRCLSGCSTHDEAHWPDTPWDLSCTSSSSCPESLAPSMWSTKRLTKVAMSVWNTATSAFSPVDKWELTHSFPNPGDGTRAGLWLESITRTGLVGGTLTMPSIEFDWIQLDNKVEAYDGFGTMNWMRLNKIWTETGGLISINYTPADCGAGNMPDSPGDNDKRCYPVKVPSPTDPNTLDVHWYHKYLVSSISEADLLEDLNTKVTSYEYVGSPAWRYAEPDALIEDKYRTWSDFRGYSSVRVRVGQQGDQTLTETKYFRGMNGDKIAGGGTREDVKVSAAVGDPILDDNLYVGMVRQSTIYNGASTEPVSQSIFEPWRSADTAKRTINEEITYARYVRSDAVIYSRIALDAGRGWRTTKATKTYEGVYGSVTHIQDDGDTAESGDEKCTGYEYNRNIAKNLLVPVSRQYTYTLLCGNTSGLSENTIIADTRYSFDELTYGAEPSKGNVTKTEVIKKYEAISPTLGTATYFTSSEARYDIVGRMVTSWDAKRNMSTTAYTPSTGGPVTQVLATNALGWTNTTTKDLRGEALTTIDANGRKTEVAYDPLGRVSKVWLTNRLRASFEATPSMEFSYAIAKTGKNSVTTRKLNAATIEQSSTAYYTTSYVLYDGLLRQRQTQTVSPGEAGGRIITDVLYDNHGRAYAVWGPYTEAGAPSGTLFVPDPGQVRQHAITQYDRADRATAEITYNGNSELWRTTTVYGGDFTTITPPDGGIPTTTIVDASGKTTEIKQPDGIEGSDATQSLVYGYNAKDQLQTVTDSGNNIWSYTYDLLGRQTSVDDPDSGLSTTEYNDAGEVTATVTGGKRLEYTYDTLGRKTQMDQVSTSDDGTTATNKLATWRYDTLASGTKRYGHASGWSRFDIDGNEYRYDITGYTLLYQAVGGKYTIPANEGALAGTYTFSTDWRADGSPHKVTYPAAGGLTQETVAEQYNPATGLPTALTGGYTNYGYVTGTTYTGLGELDSVTYAHNSAWVKQVNSYDLATRRLEAITLTRQTAPQLISDTHYVYNPAGNITSINETVIDDTQCFTYDELQRITQAWTPATGNCTDTRDATKLGGPAPYWKSYTYNPVGDRTTSTDHTATGDTTTTYQQKDPNHPHATTSATTGTTTRSFAYDDPAGNMTTRTTPTGTTQDLTWNAEGRLDTITDDTGESTHIYTADGTRLIRHDPSGATLYLPGQEIRYTTATNSTSCNRYYTHAGTTFAVRTTGGGLQWLFTDHQGTTNTSIMLGAQAITTRYQDPYGNPRGTTTTWPDEHGYVGGTNDPTGLTHIGAREYDPTLGAFITQDPVSILNDHQQLHGYSYSNNSPMLYSDPTGLVRKDNDTGGGGHQCGSVNACLGPREGSSSKPDDDGIVTTNMSNGTVVDQLPDGTVLVDGYALPAAGYLDLDAFLAEYDGMKTWAWRATDSELDRLFLVSLLLLSSCENLGQDYCSWDMRASLLAENAAMYEAFALVRDEGYDETTALISAFAAQGAAIAGGLGGGASLTFVNGGEIYLLAEGAEFSATVAIEGESLILSDVLAYGVSGAGRHSKGPAAMLRVLRTVVLPAAGKQGFTSVTILGDRISTAGSAAGPKQMTVPVPSKYLPPGYGRR